MKLLRRIDFFRAAALFLILISLGGCGHYILYANPFTYNPARKGSLDLRQFNLSERGEANLDGKWEFWWEDAVDPVYARIPGSWSHQQGRRPFEALHGRARYRLRILLPAGKREVTYAIPGLSLWIGPQLAPYRLIVNDRLMHEQGSFDTEKRQSSPLSLPVLVPLDFAADGSVGELDIRIEMANYHHIDAGLRGPLRIGAADDLRSRRDLSRVLTFFLVGAYAMIGLYHLSLFQLRPADSSPLFFGLVCFIWCLRILVTGERPLVVFWPGLSFGWQLKLTFWTFTIGLPCFALYVRALYPEHFSWNLARVFAGGGVGFSLIILLTEANIFARLQLLFELTIPPAMAYVFYVVIQAHRRERSGTFIFFFGLAAFSASILHHLAMNNNLLPGPSLLQGGLFVFLFSQAYLISRRSADAFHRKEELTANLERLAADRHRELQAALGDLEKKDALLQQELDIASEIQTGSQPEMPARFGEYYVTAYSRSVGKVGGDFFELLALSGDRTGVLIADVSGHGVPAALVANMARMSFREEARRRVSPRSIFEHVNSSMSRVIATPEYITAFFIVLAPDGKMLFSNAAHRNPAVLRRDGDIEYLRADGLLLGAFETDAQSYEEGRTRLEAGERVLLFTDGLIDAFMEEDPDAWEGNLTAFLKGRLELNADQLHGELVSYLERIQQEKHLQDDISFLIVERDG